MSLARNEKYKLLAKERRSQGVKSGYNKDTEPWVDQVITVPNVEETSNIYYSCKYTNTTNEAIIARFNETRPKTPLVYQASSYKMAVIRFDLSVNSIPMFITPFDATVGAGENFYIAYNYLPSQIIESDLIFGTVGTVEIFSINQFLDSPGGFNDTSTAVFNAMIAQYELINGPGSWTGNVNFPQVPVQLIYDETTRLFTIYADDRMLDSTGLVTFYVDYRFSNLIRGLLGSVTVPNIFTGNIRASPVNFIYKPFNINQFMSGGITYVTNTSQYESTCAWYFVEKILLLSNSLFVRNEFVSGEGNGTASNVNLPIITDFSINISNNPGDNPSCRVVYVPTAQYRMLDLLGDDPISTIDIEFALRSRSGQVFPLYLSPGNDFSVSLAFIRGNF